MIEEVIPWEIFLYAVQLLCLIIVQTLGLLGMYWTGLTDDTHYRPSKNQTIDEGMVAFKGQLSYMQYMPAKPIK